MGVVPLVLNDKVQRDGSSYQLTVLLSAHPWTRAEGGKRRERNKGWHCNCSCHSLFLMGNYSHRESGKTRCSWQEGFCVGLVFWRSAWIWEACGAWSQWALRGLEARGGRAVAGAQAAATAAHMAGSKGKRRRGACSLSPFLLQSTPLNRAVLTSSRTNTKSKAFCFTPKSNI